MIVETTITVGEARVTVRELTVAEIRARLELQSLTLPKDALHELLFDEFRVADLMDFSDISEAQVEAAKPSDLRALWARIREVNADFFATVARLKALPAPETPPDDSATQPATSSAVPSP